MILSSLAMSRPDNTRLAAVLLAVAVLLGVLVAVEFWTVLAVAVGVITIIPVMFLIGRDARDRRGWLLAVGWAVMLVTTAAQNVTAMPIGYVLEVLLLLYSMNIVVTFWRQLRFDRTLRVLAVLFIGYWLASILSTLTGRSQLVPAIWQLQYNLKWPFMFGLGFLVIWGALVERTLKRIVQYSWIGIGACVAVEIAFPGAHAAVFGPPPDLHGNPLLGVGLRYRGPFAHSGYLAITSAFLASASLAYLIQFFGRSWFLLTGGYFFLLLLSGQRQELLAFVIACLVLGLVVSWRYRSLVLVGSLLVVGLGVVGLIHVDHVPLGETLAQWGGLAGRADLSERAILTANGLEVASQYFPLGSGLGTYGGAGAQKFDQSLFVELGFGRYWWFRDGRFLVDTFWPGIMAEAGFIGAATLLLTLLVLWYSLFRRALTWRNSTTAAPCLIALAGLTLLLANSPSSGALTDPRSCFLFWVLMGAVWRVTGSEFSVGLQTDDKKKGILHAN